MKKLLFTTIFFIFTTCLCNAITLQTGISLTENVPQGFFGTWKVKSILTYSNNKEIFNEKTTDYWNLSKQNNVITLNNPLSGATATVTLNDVKNNQITFTHTSKNKNAKMTETPTLTLNGENFYGTDKIIVERYKNGELISTDIVIYKITATKISGNSAEAIFTSHY